VGYATVVVGTDGSDAALAAVGRAAELAASDAALLVVVCVADPVPAPAAALSSAEFGEPRLDQQVPDTNAAKVALATATEHAERAGAAGVSTVLVEGDPAQGLLGVARGRGADCIVVGSRGINSLSGRLLGSVPADVAYRSPCDVLIVHATGDDEQ
jgi:nucleotide-binding universal stress UspA family protein